MQRALLQFRRPQNFDLVRKALRQAHREDLIGTGRECLVPPEGVKTAHEYAQIRRERKEREDAPRASRGARAQVVPARRRPRRRKARRQKRARARHTRRSSRAKERQPFRPAPRRRKPQAALNFFSV